MSDGNTNTTPEAAFFDAWLSGVALAGPQWFGDGSGVGSSKWHLAPRYDEISAALGWLSSGEAVFLAAMYSFYNADMGGQMLATLGVGGVGGVAARLDDKRRRVIAALLVSYGGW
jgi:hypothetical protein